MSEPETRHLDERGWPDNPWLHPEWVRCELCHGTGFHGVDIEDGACHRCDGAGELVDR